MASTKTGTDSTTTLTDSTKTGIWLFPGLGCRYVGMGHDIIGRFPVADKLIEQAQSQLGYSIADVCLEGSGRKHVSSRHEAQVIYVIECAYAAVLEDLGFKPRAVSGHSLGTLAAACVCGGYDFLTGLKLVTQIEVLQEELVDGRGQAMGVIIGLSESVVQALVTADSEVYLANWNSPGQYVIGGTVGGVEGVLGAAMRQGAKQSKRLPGERAMHTPRMFELADRLRSHLAGLEFCTPHVPFISSQDASVVQTADQLRDFLGAFLAFPVRWDATVAALKQGWGAAFVEVGPGNVLSNMMPFIDRTARILSASDLLDQKTAL